MLLRSFSKSCFTALILCLVWRTSAKHVLIKSDLTKDLGATVCLKDDFDLEVLWNRPIQTPYKENIVEMASASGESGFFRPRSALARALYEKHRTDLHLEEIDKTEVSFACLLFSCYVLRSTDTECWLKRVLIKLLHIVTQPFFKAQDIAAISILSHNSSDSESKYRSSGIYHLNFYTYFYN